MHAAAQMNLENIMLSEITQKQKDNINSIYVKYSEQANTQTQKIGQQLPSQGVWGGMNGECLLMCTRFLSRGIENILKLDCGDDCTTL